MQETNIKSVIPSLLMGSSTNGIFPTITAVLMVCHMSLIFL